MSIQQQLQNMAKPSAEMVSRVILAVNPFAGEYVEETPPPFTSVLAIGDGEEDYEEPTKASVSARPHAPNPTLQQQAIQLMLDLFPGHTAADVHVSHLHSSSHDLTINISVFPHLPSLPWYTLSSFLSCLSHHHRRRYTRPTRYTLRIPHTPSTIALAYEVATLSYLSHTLPRPVPKVVVYDSSPSNALARPYILYERLPGHSLQPLWATLNTAQRQSAAREIAHFTRDLAQLRSRCPGVISVRNTVFDFKQDFVRVEQMPLSRHCSPPPPATTLHPALPLLAGPMTTRELLLDLAARQRSNAGKMLDGAPVYDRVWARVEGMVDTLHRRGLIPDSEAFSLLRAQLAADDVLVSVRDEGTVEVTGVLSWGGAVFGPSFLGKQVPGFLLGGREGGLEAYKEVMGEEWCGVAWRPEMELARKLWGVLLNGVVSGSDFFAAEELLDEFDKVVTVR